MSLGFKAPVEQALVVNKTTGAVVSAPIQSYSLDPGAGSSPVVWLLLGALVILLIGKR